MKWLTRRERRIRRQTHFRGCRVRSCRPSHSQPYKQIWSTEWRIDGKIMLIATNWFWVSHGKSVSPAKREACGRTRWIVSPWYTDLIPWINIGWSLGVISHTEKGHDNCLLNGAKALCQGVREEFPYVSTKQIWSIGLSGYVVAPIGFRDRLFWHIDGLHYRVTQVTRKGNYIHGYRPTHQI